jgi:hypothetical protein
MRALLLLPLLFVLSPSRATAAPFPATASPAQVVLGRDKVVLVQVKVPRGTPPLRAMASSGSLQPLPTTARGVFSYRWVPPDIRYPLLAVLAFWVDSPEGPPEVTTVHIPLLGRTNVDVAADVGAGVEVMVQIAELRFGPVRTNRKGRVQVPVEVPPGVREAHVLATVQGQRIQRTVPLDVPPERPLLALLSPDVIPPNGTGWLTLLGEGPAPSAQVEVQAQGGRLEAHARAPGVFRVTPEPKANALVVDARWKDGTGAARIMAPVSAPIVANFFEPQAAPQPSSPTQVAGLGPLLTFDRHALSFHLLGGGFFAGGGNLGPLVSLGAGYRLPPLEGRLAVEAELGLRQSATQIRYEPLGTMDSRVVALPLLLSARYMAFERGPFSLHARAGAGVMTYSHQMRSPFFPDPQRQSGVSFMGFLAAQAAWRVGVVSALFELRGSYAAARATQIEAQLGGLSASVGVRYAL